VQKFQEAGGIADRGKRVSKPKHPVLTTASNVFVLADEAHRTQYGSLAANLRTAMPNAVFFGFTGTPSTRKTAAPSRPSAATSTPTPSSRPSPTTPPSPSSTRVGSPNCASSASPSTK